MSYQRIIKIKCNRYTDSSFNFTLDFVDNINKDKVLIPLNVCDNSDNSDICIQCATNIWHFFSKNPNCSIRGLFDPLNPEAAAR